MKNKKRIVVGNLIATQKNKFNKYLNQSKIFLKEVAENYRKINSLL
jgi:hypothetical protein